MLSNVVASLGSVALSVVMQLALGRLLVPADFAAYAVILPLANVLQATTEGAVAREMVASDRRTIADSFEGSRVSVWGLWLRSLPFYAFGVAALIVVSDADRNHAILLALALGVVPVAGIGGTLRLALARASALEDKVARSIWYGTWSRLACSIGVAFLFPSGLALAAGDLGQRFGQYWALRSLKLPDEATVPLVGSMRRGYQRVGERHRVGSAMEALSRNIDYLVIGAFAPREILGLYYFGFQYVARIHAAFVQVARRLLPGRIARSPGVSGGGRRLFLTLGASAFLASLAAAVAFPVLDSVIWGGRWASARGPIYVLTAVTPVILVVQFSEVLLEVRRRSVWQFVVGLRSVVTGIAVLGSLAVSMTSPSSPAVGVAAAYAAIAAVLVFGRKRLSCSP